jgi:hypothetical protein
MPNTTRKTKANNGKDESSSGKFKTKKIDHDHDDEDDGGGGGQQRRVERLERFGEIGEQASRSRDVRHQSGLVTDKDAQSFHGRTDVLARGGVERHEDLNGRSVR